VSISIRRLLLAAVICVLSGRSVDAQADSSATGRATVRFAPPRAIVLEGPTSSTILTGITRVEGRVLRKTADSVSLVVERAWSSQTTLTVPQHQRVRLYLDRSASYSGPRWSEQRSETRMVVALALALVVVGFILGFRGGFDT
jgi:hypothetical protein